MNMWDEYDDGEDNDNVADLKSKNLVLQRKIKEFAGQHLILDIVCMWMPMAKIEQTMRLLKFTNIY
jgi:hypothetical protein